MIIEEILGNPPREIMDRVGELQSEMHMVIDGVFEKTNAVSYQDCVTIFLLLKIAQVESRLKTLNKE